MHIELRLKMKARIVMRSSQPNVIGSPTFGATEQYEELQYRNIGVFGPITQWLAVPKVGLHDEDDEDG